MTMRKESLAGVFSQQQIGRRPFNTALAALGIGLMTVPLLRRPAAAASDLTYFTWSGYEIPEFHKAYVEKYGAGPEASLFGDDEEGFQKIRAGFSPDITHPCFDKIDRFRAADLIQPIDVSRIPEWASLFPSLTSLPGVQSDGQVWFVPWDWGNTSILYRTDLVEIKEESWSLLWDDRYSGRMATIDAIHDTPVVAAIVAGVDPFNLSDADLPKVRAALEKQRPLVRMYTTDMTSVEQALASGELVAAMTWNDSMVRLTQQGLPVKFMQPKEGILTWVCGYVLHKGTPNLDKAYDFINARLAPESGAYLINEYGYGNANRKAFELISEARLAELGLPKDPSIMLDNSVVLRPMRDADAVTRMFEEVKAGY
ncbi:ABC transporter substrate-binding protein [Virgifigura deserti]|uniref:ABC transporter substrate-binding protein n=1 Tax=Virgifigura deserti TaxID=2268457 RepID=UPI003CCB7F47